MILAPETQQIGLTLLVGKLGQILLTAGILVILEQLGTVPLLVEAISHDIAQQADKRQVDGLAQCIANRRDATVILFAEVVEGVHTATGKEAFVGAR